MRPEAMGTRHDTRPNTADYACRGLASSPETLCTFGPQRTSAGSPKPGDRLTGWMPVDHTLPTRSSLLQAGSVSYFQFNPNN